MSERRLGKVREWLGRISRMVRESSFAVRWMFKEFKRYQGEPVNRESDVIGERSRCRSSNLSGEVKSMVKACFK
jgi:hypothetical protein